MEKIDIQHVTTCAFLFLNEFWYACDFGQREINGSETAEKGTGKYSSGGRTLLDEIQTGSNSMLFASSFFIYHTPEP